MVIAVDERHVNAAVLLMMALFHQQIVIVVGIVCHPPFRKCNAGEVAVGIIRIRRYGIRNVPHIPRIVLKLFALSRNPPCRIIIIPYFLTGSAIKMHALRRPAPRIIISILHACAGVISNLYKPV